MSDVKNNDEAEDSIIESNEYDSIEEVASETPIEMGEVMRNTVPGNDPETVRFEGTGQHKWTGVSGCSAYINSAAHRALLTFFNAQVAAHPDLHWSEANYTGGTASIKKRGGNRRKCWGYVNVDCYIIFTKIPT